MKNILVTGGAGYIGSHTCKLLASSGYNPITYDNLSTGHRDSVKWGPLEIGDLQDTPRLMQSFNKYHPMGVIHFASSAYVGESMTNPFKYYENNVGGTISLLDAMRATNVKNIVFSSTCATYGMPELKIISEECPQIPINPYGKSKLMIENILTDLARVGEINQISLRYFNAAGDDRDGEIGERHDPETHLIPLAIFSAHGGPQLKVFGFDYATPDGSAVRDYIHVEDLAKGHILSIEYLLSGGESDVFNLGTGKGHSVLEVISSLQKLGVQVNFSKASRRDGDPAYLVADSTKAKRILNWEPEYLKLDQILNTAMAWHFKQRLKE